MSNILHIDRNTGAITVNQLTASRLLSTDGSKALVSSDLVFWVAGTTNQVTVTDDGDGTITLSGPQDIHTGATPTFAGLTVDAGASPGTLLTVQSTGETANSIIDFQCERYLLCNYTVARTSGAATQFTVRRSRGTLASPSAVANNDEIGAFVFRGYDGYSYINVCGIKSAIEGTVSENSVPGSLYFYTNSGASNYRVVGKFDDSGLFIADYGVKAQNLTPSRLVASNADQKLVSSDLVSWVTGTSNRVTVTDDGDGTITLSGPQDIHTGATPTFAGLTLSATNPGLLIKASSSTASEAGEIQFQSLQGDSGPRIRLVNDESSNNFRIDVRRLPADSWTNSLYIYRGTAGQEGRVGIKTSSPDAVLDVNGDARFGDGTNYAEIKTDGEVNLHGTARVKQGIWVDANGIKAPGAKPATEISHGDLEIAAWQFANEGVAANQQSVSWSCRIPEPMDRTVAPTVSIGWSADGVSPGNCEWQLEYFWTGPDDDTTQAAEETLTQTTAASSTANGMVLTTFTGINAPDASDICLHCRLTRLSAGANDTINDTVELHGACLQYTCDKLGEAT